MTKQRYKIIVNYEWLIDNDLVISENIFNFAENKLTR